MNIGGLTQLCEELHIGETFASALKKAAGITARKFDINVVKRWWAAHPNFKITDVRPRNSNPQRRRPILNPPELIVGTSREPLLTHGQDQSTTPNPTGV